MNENSEQVAESKTNKYQTRKKIIDFAKIGEKLSLTGSNCHYCKSIMCVQDSNACRNTEKINLTKKKTCNKKFCYDCLQKTFPPFWDTRNSKDWKCPCCLNECPCSQCKKIWIKSKPYAKMTTVEISEEIQLEENENSKSIEVEYREGEANITITDNNQKAFDINSIHSLLHSSKISCDKFSSISRPKIEIITENDFLNFKRAKENFVDTLEKYKDKLNYLNFKHF